ncbi:MAG: MBL fold metallo-hydrolase, partial [Thermomicrobiaceae bacterium]|nr:MBL fold metallo-hydrolase [Thermomicrobiaceae bacterium]
LFDRIAAERAMISVYHFPFPGLARVSPAPVGWAWERVE